MPRGCREGAQHEMVVVRHLTGGVDVDRVSGSPRRERVEEVFAVVVVLINWSLAVATRHDVVSRARVEQAGTAGHGPDVLPPIPGTAEAEAWRFLRAVPGSRVAAPAYRSRFTA